MVFWFKPARFWNWFAFYYPASWQGWVATIILAVIFVALFLFTDSNSHSGGDTLISFAPWAISILIIFDFLCFRFGEYPSWWRKGKNKEL